MVKRNYKVIWEDQATASLRSIFTYIKKRETTDQARKVSNEIRDLAKSLGFMPHKYAEDTFLKEDPGDTRFKVIWSYKIVYEITHDTVIYTRLNIR